MNIIFRVDSSSEIGGGHLVRCLNLALSLKKEGGHQIVFCCADLEGNSNFLIQEKGFELYVIEKQNSVVDGNAQAEVDFLKRLADNDSVLILDHYSIDSLMEEPLRPYFKKIVVIDDLANRKHSCDILVDYNFYLNKKRYEDLIPSDATLLLGTKYCILSDSFEARPSRVDNSMSRVLLFFGSNDAHNLCTRVYKFMARHYDNLSFDVVVGENSKYNKELLELEKDDMSLKVHIQTDKMYELMSASNLYIGSGGTITWERFFCGIPSLVISVADNQVESCGDLYKSRYIEYLGHFDEADIDERCLSQFSSFIEGNLSLKCGQELVDNLGKVRILNCINKVQDRLV